MEVRKLRQRSSGIAATAIKTSWLTMNPTSQGNAFCMKPYECRPTPSMLTPNQEKLVTTLPKIAPGIYQSTDLYRPSGPRFDVYDKSQYHPNASVQRYTLDGLSYWPEEYTLLKVQALLQTWGPGDAVTRYLARQGAIAASRR